ncbi:hypothetical protein ACIOEX_30520, partial [Streptomyces sp. NPDC087850]|uniref:hypothetical protein n=1 Tax=Streptomyces sp. NPDC087850 TaxID=3365809 RepID=UPI00381EAF4C
MSTEAPRAPVPPRPTTPPRAPGPATPSADAPADPRRAGASPAAARVADGRRLRPPPLRIPAQSPDRTPPPARPAAPSEVRRPVYGAPTPAVPPPVSFVRPARAPVRTPPPPVPGSEVPAPSAVPERPVAPPYPWPSPPEYATLVPVPARHPGRTAAAVVCAVLGLGLIGGAVTGSWLTGDSAAEPAVRDGFTTARALWHSVPVNSLFPTTLTGDGAGPGGSDRDWTRVGVAPDSGCARALDPLLLTALRPVGCARVLRATYVDATSSSVTTVGLVFTEGDATTTAALRTRFRDEDLADRADLMPRTFQFKDTPAAAFVDAQRA